MYPPSSTSLEGVGGLGVGVDPQQRGQKALSWGLRLMHHHPEAEFTQCNGEAEKPL